MDAQPASSRLYFSPKAQPWLTMAGFALFYAFLVWLYYPALDSFFANDDWVILYHNSKIPPGEWWRYFSPKTIWFYRPLQSMQFGLTWHAAGLNHKAYSVQLLIMHLVVCTLAWVFLKQLFGRALAWLATFLFSISWIYADILLWKANFNTLHHAITTLTACITFTLYLQTRRRRWFWGTVAAAVATWFTKESGVGLPLVLAVIWITINLKVVWEDFPSFAGGLHKIQWRKLLVQFIKDLGVFVAIALAYVVLHKALLENVEPNYPPGYVFVSPVTMLLQWMHGTTHAIFGFFYDPLLGAWLPWLSSLLASLVENSYVVPFVLLVLGLWFRSPAVVFGVLITAATQFPHFALQVYHASRYYYLPALGGACVLSATILSASENLGKRPIGHRLIGYIGIIAFAYVVTANVVTFQQTVRRDLQQSAYMEEAFRILARKANAIPEGSLIIFKNAPDEFINQGMGATEQVRLATGRSDLIAVTDKEVLTEAELRRFNLVKNRVVLDVLTLPR